MRRLALVAVIAACGRIGFDPIGDGGGGGGGGGDGKPADGTGTDTGGGMACPLTATPSCPVTGTSLSIFGTHTSSGDTAGKGSGLTGSCGGANAEEHTTQFFVQQAGTFIFTTRDSTLDTVLYVRDTCTGAELACNDNENGSTLTSRVMLTLAAGQSVVVVVDGANGTCGGYTLRAGTSP